MLKSKIKFMFCSVLLFDFFAILFLIFTRKDSSIVAPTLKYFTPILSAHAFCYSLKCDKFTLNIYRPCWLVSQDPVCYVIISA